MLGLTKHCILKTGLVLINTVSSIQKVESYYTMYPQNRLCPTTHLSSKYRLCPTTHCILKTEASAFYNFYLTNSVEAYYALCHQTKLGSTTHCILWMEIRTYYTLGFGPYTHMLPQHKGWALVYTVVFNKGWLLLHIVSWTKMLDPTKCFLSVYHKLN